MADLSAFSNSTFNSSSWINSALDMKDGSLDMETYISSLATKLHIMSQDYTDQLETAMVESMSTMPRILSEITKTEEQLRAVESEMKSLSSQLNSFDQRNVTGVEDLSRLDTLKSNMEKCKATLEEHARWSQLVREAKTLLEGGGKLSDSADRIETMFRSLSILRNLPGNKEREETCDMFKNSLLNALRPIVRRDVAGADVAPLQEYLYVFQKLDREFELEEEYIKARPERIRSVWENYSLTKNTEFPPWLARFLGSVAQLVAEEEMSTQTLFGASRAPVILCDLIVEAVKPLVHTGRRGLAARLAAIGSPVTSFDSYCVSEEFTRRMLKYIASPAVLQQQQQQQQEQAVSGVGVGVADSADFANTSSASNNNNNNNKGKGKGKGATALAALLGGFVAHLPQYAEAETVQVRAYFIELLDSIAFSSGSSSNSNNNNNNNNNKSGVDSAVGGGGGGGGTLDDELFGESGEAAAGDAYSTYGDRLLAASNEYHVPLELALKRCVKFAGGVNAKHVIRSLASELVLYVRHLIHKLDDLSVASGFPRDTSLSMTQATVAGTTATTTTTAASAPATVVTGVVVGNPAANSGVGGEGGFMQKLEQQSAAANRMGQQLETSSDVDSRVLITSALRSLQAIGRFVKHFHALEVTVRAMLQELQHALFHSSNSGISLASVAADMMASTTTTTTTTTTGKGAASGSNSSIVGTLYAKQFLEEDPDVMSELRSFLVAATSTSQHLSHSSFAAVTSYIQKFRLSGCRLLFNLCIEAPEKIIASYATEDVWAATTYAGKSYDRTSPAAAPAPGAAGAAAAGAVSRGEEGKVSPLALEERDQLRESMLPQSVVTLVGEHLLSLVQELESFAASDALPDLLRLRGGTSALSGKSSGWQAVKTSLEMPDDGTLECLCKRQRCAPLIATIESTLLGSSAAALTLAAAAQQDSEGDMTTSADAVKGGNGSSVEDEYDDMTWITAAQIDENITATKSGSGKIGAPQQPQQEMEDVDTAAVLTFVNEWLGCIADAMVGLVLAQLLNVPVFTAVGCAQLLTDVEYLSNVINAMGLPPHPLLAHMVVLMQQEPQQLVKSVDMIPGKTKGAVGYLLNFDHIVVNAVAKGYGL